MNNKEAHEGNNTRSWYVIAHYYIGGPIFLSKWWSVSYNAFFPLVAINANAAIGLGNLRTNTDIGHMKFEGEGQETALPKLKR